MAAAICAALHARGARVAPFKPVLTGIDEPGDPDWPPDDELLASAAAWPHVSTVAPRRFGPAVSPHLAAELAGTELVLDELEAAARAAAEGNDFLVCEGIGGLLVPLTGVHTVRDFAARLGLPVVIAARPGLGTINHTLLTLEAARAAGLHVAGVVMTPWPTEPGVLERSNRATVARLGDVEVSALPPLPRPDRSLLATAGAWLPLGEWLSPVRPAA